MKMKYNMKAFKEIRNSEEIQELIQKHVDNIESTLGEGYESEVSEGKTRARGAVWTKDYEAIHENAKNNTLIKALAQEAGGSDE